MNKKTKQTIKYLKFCKSVFLGDGSLKHYQNLGMTEVEDLLDGIYHDGKKCYVSYLFSQLTKKDKKEISGKLDFYVDFEGLYAIYYI